MNVYPIVSLLVAKKTNKRRPYKKTALIASIFWGSINISIAAVSPLWGGSGGNPFTDTVATTQTLTGISLHANWWIDGIQGISNTGALPYHGGTGGNTYNITWPSNEYLVRTYGTTGYLSGTTSNIVGKISFVTNTGRVLGPYGSGNSGTGTYGFDYTVPAGNQIVGFTGRAGSYIDAFGVVYNPIQTNNLIVNGSFESPVIPANSAQLFPSISGWIGSGDGIEVGTPNVYGVTGATGSQVNEIDVNATGTKGTGIYQMVTTVAQQSYKLSVNAAMRSGTNAPDNRIEVWWRNQYLGIISPTSTSFTTYTFNVVGSGGSDRLEFREIVGNDNSQGGVIDNVILQPNTTTPVAPDVSVSIAQPSPALAVNALSEIPVTLTNMGNQDITVPLTLVMNTYPESNGVLKFAQDSGRWLCLRTKPDVNTDTLTCTYRGILKQGTSTTVRLPFTPGNFPNWTPGPFAAVVTTSIPGETNVLNNTSPSMLPDTPVKALTLGSIADPNYSVPLLDPTLIPKYATALPNAFADYFKHTPNTTVTPGTDVYNLAIKQINSQILPPGFPSTPVYAYGDPAQPNTFSYPSHTIVANSVATGLNASGLGKPVKIKFTDLRNPALPHLLPIDRSIHGAMRGEPDIRSITHLHGIKTVNQNSDGYPEAWYSPNGQTGNQFTVTSPTVGYNANPFDYPNNQESTLMWFHDHSLGMTRLNVYAGLAGLYLLRDSNEQTMINNNSLPNGAYELPLVLQDKAFKTDGSLAYPNLNPAVPGAPANSMVPEFYGNVMLVNGTAWPFLDVEPRKYRFRVLNGSSSRFYNLTLSNNASFQVIGTEGGFLAAPTTVTSLTVAPAERYDIIVDFSAMNGQTITLMNSANSPFPGAILLT